MHWIPFEMVWESASELHQICGDSAPSIQQWSVLPILFLKYGRPDNHLLHRCHRILSGIPVDGMHFLSAGIHTGQSAGLDTDGQNGIPTSSFCFRLCVRHGLQAPASRLPGSHDRNTTLHEDDHKESINILCQTYAPVCHALPCNQQAITLEFLL